jgi:HAE1 family hydrophobic/amphiphilic exporter-1
MRRITQLFVNRPPLVFVLITLVTLAGCFALATLVQQQFPNIDFPTINTSVSYPGASPSELRDSVVRPIEDAIAGANRIKRRFPRRSPSIPIRRRT